jgi:hypothetical protein
MSEGELTQEVIPGPCSYNTTHFLTPPPTVVKTLATADVDTEPKL